VVTSITSAFQVFRSRLEITDLQAQTVSTRQKSVRTALEEDLTVVDSFLTGSYSRHTMISPLSEADIDVFSVLHHSYFHQDGQVALLEKVKGVLKKTYPKTPEISRNGQAVTITFSDFKVDVVPAFNRNGGGYLIPTTVGSSWISTDPKAHVQLSSQLNATHNNDLVPLVKMLKEWNRTIDRPFRSFHLEVLAWSIFDGVEISSFSSGVRYFFDKGRHAISQKNPDPAGYGGDVGFYINSTEKIEAAVSRFTTAYSRALKAEEYARNGHVSNSIDEWRKIFGERFPIYG
jgi:hypothetical protein